MRNYLFHFAKINREKNAFGYNGWVFGSTSLFISCIWQISCKMQFNRWPYRWASEMALSNINNEKQCNSRSTTGHRPHTHPNTVPHHLWKLLFYFKSSDALRFFLFLLVYSKFWFIALLKYLMHDNSNQYANLIAVAAAVWFRHFTSILAVYTCYWNVWKYSRIYKLIYIF